MIEGFEAQQGAVIIIEGDAGPTITVPAVVLFELPGGFGWLEPAYITDTETASAPGHAIAGTVERDPAGPGLYFSGPRFSGWIERAPAGDPAIAAAWAAWKKKGLTLDEEREAFRAQIAERLG